MIPLLYIRMVYCIPSIIFYVMVMCWIFKDRHRLFGSFFFLLVMQAITNFIVFIDNVYLIQLADETDEETWWRVIYTGSPQALTRIFAFMGIHFAFVQAYVTLLISVNRMTVIVWSAKGEQLWNVGLPICAFVCYTSPFAATYPFLTQSASWHFSSTSHSYVLLYNPGVSATWMKLYIFVFAIIVASSSVNLVSLVTLFLHRKRTNFVRAQRSMLILALLDFLVEIAVFVLMTIVYMDQPDDEDDERIALALVPFAIDLMTLSTPYLLIAFNQSLRTRMIHSLRCHKRVHPAVRLPRPALPATGYAQY
ncbi:hypothetical protein V3C99_012800 [Haemonchus contortus]